LSQVVAGLVVVHAGYETAFLGFAAVGLGALMLVCTLMPETNPRQMPSP
jgi:hypothetical protein